MLKFQAENLHYIIFNWIIFKIKSFVYNIKKKLKKCIHFTLSNIFAFVIQQRFLVFCLSIRLQTTINFILSNQMRKRQTACSVSAIQSKSSLDTETQLTI